MWIKTSTGILVNLDQIDTINRVEANGQWQVTAFVGDGQITLSTGSSAETEAAVSAIESLTKAVLI